MHAQKAEEGHREGGEEGGSKRVACYTCDKALTIRVHEIFKSIKIRP